MKLDLDYQSVDKEERLLFLSSRNPILNKSWVSDLWCRVIQRAIDDIILFEKMRANGEKLSEENITDEQTANNLLFDSDHRIPLDDYHIKLSCPQCKESWEDWVSKIAGNDLICPSCGNETIWKYVSYDIVPGQDVKDISLQELLDSLGIENIDGFRAGCKEYIEIMTGKNAEKAHKPEPRQKRPYTRRNLEYWNNLKRKKPKAESRRVIPDRIIELLPEPVEQDAPIMSGDMAQEIEDTLLELDKMDVSPGNEDSHYVGIIQPIDFIEDQQLGHHEANVVKYICRWKRKGGLEDLKKAVWFLHRLIRLQEKDK